MRTISPLPPRRPYRAAHRSADDGVPTTYGAWALLVAQAILGVVAIWVVLALFLTAFA